MRCPSGPGGLDHVAPTPETSREGQTSSTEQPSLESEPRRTTGVTEVPLSEDSEPSEGPVVSPADGTHDLFGDVPPTSPAQQTPAHLALDAATQVSTSGTASDTGGDVKQEELPSFVDDPPILDNAPWKKNTKQEPKEEPDESPRDLSRDCVGDTLYHMSADKHTRNPHHTELTIEPSSSPLQLFQMTILATSMLRPMLAMI